MKHPTKILAAIVLLAGAALGWVALRAESPTYSAPASEAMPDSVPSALSSAPAADEAVHTFDVEGMCCSGCTGKLYRRLVLLEGVEEAAVDFESGRAQVRVATSVDPARIEESLRFDKYDARLVP